MFATLRAIRRLLRGPARSRRYDSAQHGQALIQAHWLVKAYYLASLVVTFQLCIDLHGTLSVAAPPALLWPVFWLAWLPLSWAQPILILATLAVAGIAVLFPHFRPARVAFSLLFIFGVAARFSYGYFNHGYHLWLWLSVLFIFFPLKKDMPMGGGRPAARHIVVSWFFAAQLLIAVFYSLSGMWKALRGVIIPRNGISSFAPDALPAMVFDRWTYNEYPTVLQAAFQDFLWVAWPGHLLVIFVELFALVAVFRPEMHRFFGTLLMIFHFGVWLLMGIDFTYQPMTIALLFVFSPMAVARKFNLRRFVLQLPLFGDLLGLAIRVAKIERGTPIRGVGV